METRQQTQIREALEHSPRAAAASSSDVSAAALDDSAATALQKPPTEASLRRKSLRRASRDYVPRTLTPHEWEEYYREHGVPEAHRRRGTVNSSGSESAARGLLSWLRARLSPPGRFPDTHSQ